MSWAHDRDIPVQSEKQVSNHKNVVGIVSKDIQEEVEYLSSSTIVCYVLRANPFSVIESFFGKVRGKLGI